MTKALVIGIRALAIGFLSLSVQGSQNIDPPCTDCGPLPLKATQTISSLSGCYLAGYTGTKAVIRVRRVSENAFELDMSKSASRTPFLLLHTADRQDLKTVAAGFGAQLDDGISVADGNAMNANPVGIYRGFDARGQRITLAYLLFYNGNLEPTPCS